MIKCLVIDDEPLAGKLIGKYVDAHPSLTLQKVFSDPILAIREMDDVNPDLLFLDVQMPQLTGIQFMKIKKEVPVILTTAYEEYALEGYNFLVVDYLLKPITKERFDQAIEKFHNLNYKGTRGSLSKSAYQTSPFFVKSEHKVIRVNLNDILFLESLGDYVAFQTNSHKILTLENLKDLALRLPQSFVRVHRSFIVNLDKIDFIENNRIVIGDQRIPISQSYRDDFWARSEIKSK